MKTQQNATANSPERRRELKNPRIDERKLEDQRLTIPTEQKGYTTPPMPGPDANNKGPAVPPLSTGRNWNATRPKAGKGKAS